MRPNTPHYVVTLENSIVHGRHFYSSSTMIDTVLGVVRTFLMGIGVTNALHDNTRVLLRRMMVMWVDVLVIKTDEPG